MGGKSIVPHTLVAHRKRHASRPRPSPPLIAAQTIADSPHNLASMSGATGEPARRIIGALQMNGYRIDAPPFALQPWRSCGTMEAVCASKYMPSYRPPE